MSNDVRLSGAQTAPRSESDVRINYNDGSKIIGAANVIATAPQAQFYSSDGGASWGQTSLPFALGDSNHTDPAVDWTSDGTAWAITIAIPNNQLRAYKSNDGGSSWNFDGTPSGTQTTADKEMMWVDHSPTSPHKDNIYVIWQRPAWVARRTGGAWQAPVQVSGAETTGSTPGADIKTNSVGDVFAFWPDTGSGKLYVAKSTDGGGSFGVPVTIANTFGRFQVAVPAQASRKVLIYISAGAFHTNSQDHVYAVWMDLSGDPGCNSGGGPGTDVTSTCKTRIWFSRSTDGGGSWSNPQKINDQNSLNDQFFPRLVVDETSGLLMVVYYDTVGDPSRVKTDIWKQTSSDGGLTWSAAEKITTAETDETSAGADSGNQYGDYIGLTGNAGDFFACWTDRRSGGLEEIWGVSIPVPQCFLIVDKSTFGQDEVEVGLPGTASYTPAYWVGVEGFTAAQLGLMASNLGSPPLIPTVTATVNPALNPTLTAAQIAAINTMLSVGQFGPPPVVAEDPTLQQVYQRFLFPFVISFNGDGGFVAMQPNQVAIVTLNASITAGNVTRTASANIELTKGEDPYFEDVDLQNPNQPSWLSFDLRFFKAIGGQSRFGAPAMSNDPADAPGFITNVISNLNNPAANLGGDSFAGLTQDEDASALEFLQKDNGGNFTFNFSLARVRLIGNTPGAQAKAVRVFFRLFQAQTTGSDFNEQTTYRFATDGAPSGHKIALLGVQNDQNGNPEYVTIPCFATPRVNLNGPADMHGQNDPPNVIDITVNPGQEVDTYFGCWLDINQPQQQFLPATPPAGNFDGPWNGIPLLSLNEVITRAPHQCLIAEIRFDDTPIPAGATSATSDKLAQRNIAWIDGPNPGAALSRRMPHPFEIRPSPTAVQTTDELMILWGDTPRGSTASLYLPALNANDILSLANRMYVTHLLTAQDAHTIQCPVGGVTFIPIPKGTARNAGLMTVDLAPGIRRGQVFNIVVRQITEASAKFVPPPPPPPAIAARRVQAAVNRPSQFRWRRLLGAFQITITISTKEQLLFPEERLLAWLRWIQQAIPLQNRWYLVFQRYVEQIGGRVLGFGGNPSQIPPSPTGQVPGEGPEPEPGEEGEEERESFTGKIEGLIFDRFGDFEGFVLDTEDGDRKFFSREKEIEQLAERAWRERLRITVWVETDERHRALTIIVRQPPAPFQN
jgi:hypothetical protein